MFPLSVFYFPESGFEKRIKSIIKLAATGFTLRWADRLHARVSFARIVRCQSNNLFIFKIWLLLEHFKYFLSEFKYQDANYRGANTNNKAHEENRNQNHLTCSIYR